MLKASVIGLTASLLALRIYLWIEFWPFQQIQRVETPFQIESRLPEFWALGLAVWALTFFVTARFFTGRYS
jgi:hypothetical protein